MSILDQGAIPTTINPLDVGFDREIQYWEANKDALSSQYPGKFLIFRDCRLDKVLDSLEEVDSEFENFETHPFLCRETRPAGEREPVLLPTSIWEVIK